MTLPEALELLDYLSENPPAHRAIAIAHRFKKKDEGTTSVPLTPEMLQQMAPGGLVTMAAMAGIPSAKGS